MSRMLACFLPVLFLAIPDSVAAQTDDFSITSWDVRNGLPDALVRALAVRPETGVWVATEGGLCLFDGSNCKSLPIDQIRKFPLNEFTALLIAHDQSLWAGTEGGGLLHIEKGRVESFTRRDGLTDGYVRAIYEDSHKNLWVGTDFGLFEKTGTSFQHIELGKSALPQFVQAIVEDSSGRLIIGGRSLTVIDGNVAVPVAGWAESGSPQIKSLLFTRKGQLIVGAVDGAFEVDGQHIKRLRLPKVDIESLCQSADGAIWAGTVAEGLWRLKGSTASRVGFGEGGIALSVLAMSTDSSGRLWVGSERGLSRIEETSVHFVDSPAFAVDRETLAVSLNGTVNLVNGSLFRIEGNKELRPLSLPIPSNTRILDALYSSDGSIWLGTAGPGVYRVDSKGRVTQYSTRSHLKLSADFPRGIVEGTHGDIWVATEFGVNIISKGKVELLSASNGLPSRAVRTMFLDHKGCMWTGTDAGVSVSCNGTLLENQATSALHGEEVWAIAEGPTGTMWFGTRRNGIYEINDSNLRHLTTANGLPSNDICGLIVDRTGNLWASSLNLLFSISLSQFAMTREKDFVTPISYVLPSSAEGLRFTRGRIPSAALDARGAVWFATDRGAIFIDNPISSSHGSDYAPTPVVESIIVDNSILLPAPKMKTPPNPRRVDISFGTEYLGPAQQVLLMYRLIGVDESWVISLNSHQAEYSNLSAGTYRFELRACDRAQPDRWKTLTCLIVVPVIWYRSPWFFGALAIGVLGIVFLGYFLHLRRVRYGFRLILEERSRMAREMHDTLIQGCNGVAMLLEAEASSRNGSGESNLLSVARAQIRATVSDAREALWNLRQSHTDANYVRETIESIAAHATSFFGVPVEVRFSRKPPILPSSAAHELMMIVREAVTNAGTHGSARKISICAQMAANNLSIDVSDDGVGFDVQSAATPLSDHFGIRGMRERAAKIGATFEIASSPGRGTVVKVSLPCERESIVLAAQ